MDIKLKTSTHKLATEKDAKRLRKTPIYRKMDEVIGFQEFLDIEDKGKRVTALLKCVTGYSLIIKVSSSDPYLLSEDDLSSFEMSGLSFSFGLDSNIKFIRANRKQNFKKYIAFVNEISKKVACSDYIENYKKELINELHMMENGSSGNLKLNYIVVYSNDPNDAVAKKSVLDKAGYVLRNLQDNNFKTSILTNFDLIEYLYKCLHKDINIDLETFLEKGAFSILTKKIDDFQSNIEITDDFIKNVALSLEKDSSMEIEKRSKLGSKEYKKYMKKLKKEKILQDKKHLKEIKGYNLTQTSFIDILKPDVFVEEPDYIKLSTESFVRFLVVNTFPQNLNIATLDTLNTIENMEIHVDLMKLNDAKMSKTLRAESNKIISNIYLKEKETGTREHAQRKKASAIEGLIETIETNSDKLFAGQIIVKLWGDDLTDLEEKTKTIIENFANLAMDLRVMFYDQKSAFMNTLPIPVINYKENFKNLTAGGVSCLIPSGCTHLRHSEGVFVGRSLMTNYPLILDHFICQKPHFADSEKYSNPNTYIVGKPGSGKSVYMKTRISRSSFLGDLNVVLDPHSEYKTLAEKLGGKYIYLKNGVKTGINPLEIKVVIDEDTNEEKVPIHDKINEISALINNFIATYRKGEGLSGIEISTVYDAVKTVYEERGITTDPNSLFIIENGKKVPKPRPTLSDLKVVIDRYRDKIEDIAEMMKIITGDGMMGLFDCETDDAITKILDTKLVVFSLKELDDLTKTYAMTTILNWIWAMFSAKEMKGIQKNIGIDEGWRLSKHKESLLLLENFIRSGRKYLISVNIASQSIHEFSATEEGRAILDFCSFKYIFRQDAKLANEIGDNFGLSDSVKKAIPNFSKGQCIVCTEAGNMMVQVDLFEKEKEFATTSGKSLSEMKEAS